MTTTTQNLDKLTLANMPLRKEKSMQEGYVRIAFENIVDAIDMNDEVEESHVDEIRKYVPNFLTQFDDEVIRDRLTLEDLRNTGYQDILKFFGTINVVPRAPPSLNLPSGSAPASTAKITQMAVLGAFVKSNDKAVQILSTLGSLGENWTGKEWSEAIGLIHNMNSRIDGSKTLGAYNKISDNDLLLWTESNDKEVLLVSDYVLMKILAQVKVESEMYTDLVAGTWMKWTRNRVTVASNRRREIVLDVEGTEFEKEEPGNVWRTFLAGMKDKNKQVAYKPVDIWAYRIFDLLSSIYKISKNSKEPQYDFIQVAKPPKLTDKVRDFMVTVKGVLEKTHLGETDADMIIERAVQAIFDAKLDDSDFRSYYDKSAGNLSKKNAMTITLLSEASRASPMEKEAALLKVGAVKDTTSVVKSLGEDRKVRNAAAVSQYVNKNVGGVHTDVLPQMMDTVLKGDRIVTAMAALGVKVDDPKTHVHVYGVAYGHMTAAFRKRKCAFTYYDIKKAANSHSDQARGDVFDANGQYIIDDTLVRDSKEEYAANLGKNWTHDHSKVKMFLDSQTTDVVISKLQLESLDTVDRQKTMLNMIYGQQRYTYAQFAKFGKLHNGEIFLILATGHKRGKALAGDLKTISQCISVANSVIMAAQSVGLRCVDNSTKITNSDGSVTNGETMSKVWEALIGALPVPWPWYVSKYTKDNRFTMGIFRDTITLDDDAYDAGIFAVSNTTPTVGKKGKVPAL